jgi:aminopeptidase N
MASIAWDEARFGLPLDLERFMVVAVDDFNMGAMENKGLNIFNTSTCCAAPRRRPTMISPASRA